VKASDKPEAFASSLNLFDIPFFSLAVNYLYRYLLPGLLNLSCISPVPDIKNLLIKRPYDAMI